MTPSRARFIASSFNDYEGFKVLPFTRHLKVIEPNGKRSLFLKEEDFFKYAGDLVADRCFSNQQNNT